MIEIEAALTRQRFSLEAQLTLEQRVTGVFGPSGSGKSTLLNIVAGLVRPSSGRIVVNGTTLCDSEAGVHVPIHKRRIGLVFQDSRLFPHHTVRGNLEYGFGLLRGRERLFGFSQIVEMLELGRLLGQRPYQLSGGEKQRVALGRALLSSPQLLLLDEPLASLDNRLKDQILPFLKRVAGEINIPMIYVSHAINEILHLTPNIVFIENGRVLAHGNFHEALHHKEALRLAHTLGLENVMQVRVVAHDRVLGYTRTEHFGRTILIPLCEAEIGAPVSICVPASNVALALRAIDGVTIQNQIAGTVVAIESVGPRVLVSVDVGSTVMAEVTAKAIQELKLTPGSQVRCLIKMQAIRLLGGGQS